MAGKSAKSKSKSPRLPPISVTLSTGEKVWPFKPPSQRSWRKIVKKLRTDHPVSIPVRITRSLIAIDGTMCDSGEVVIWYENGRPVRAHIWISSLQQRAMAIDSLLHEWAHVMRELEDPNPDGSMKHDDAFYIAYGMLCRSWMSED